MMEPRVSVPIENPTQPAAVADPGPADEPLDPASGFQGLTGTQHRGSACYNAGAYAGHYYSPADYHDHIERQHGDSHAGWLRGQSRNDSGWCDAQPRVGPKDLHEHEQSR